MLRVENLTKSYRVAGGRHYVFRDVTIDFPEGANIGIIGPNGAGKSTFLRILGGIDYPDQGRILTNHTFSWPLGLRGGFVPHLSGRENCRMICHLYGLPANDIRRKLEYIKELTEIGDYFEEPVKFYSSGMGSRLGFGLSMAFDFDYFLIDEITAVGDARFKQLAKATLEEKARRSKVIMVSHSMNDIRNFCEVGVLVKDGNIQVFKNLDDAIEAYLPQTEEDPEAEAFIKVRESISQIHLQPDQAAPTDQEQAKRTELADKIQALEEVMAAADQGVAVEDGARFHLRLGHLYMKMGHPKRAIRHFEESLEIDGFQILPHIRIAQLCTPQGQMEESKAHLDEAARLDPKHPDLNVQLASYHLKLNQLEEAEACQLKAIRAKPKNANNWFLLARIFYAANKLDEAVDALVKAVQLKGDNPAFYRLLSNTLFQMGAHLPALEAGHRSATLQPTTPPPRDYDQLLKEVQALADQISG